MMNPVTTMTEQQAQDDFEATFNRAINGETVLIQRDGGRGVCMNQPKQIKIVDGEKDVLIHIEEQNENYVQDLCDAIAKLSKTNADKIVQGFSIPYMPEKITGRASNLTKAFAYEMKCNFKSVCEYYGDSYQKATEVIVFEYYRGYFETSEWYRLARENGLINKGFTDGYCDETTFFCDGVFEIFDDLKVLKRIEDNLKGIIDVQALKEADYGDKFLDSVCCVAASYAFHVADMHLEKDLKLSLNYLCLAHRLVVLGFSDVVLQGQHHEDKREKTLRSKTMLAAKHAKDPKQAAKIQIKELWLDWQAHPYKFESAAQFATHCMMNLTEPNGARTFETSRQIETWCTTWKKEQNKTPSA